MDLEFDFERNKRINEIVNILHRINVEYIYFSPNQLTIYKRKTENTIKIKRLPVFDSAEKILVSLEEKGLEFKKENIKIS